jgi:hypothetical protein
MGLVKLKILSYSDTAFSADEQSYEALINPPSYDLTLAFDYKGKKTINGVEIPQFHAIPPQQLKLDFMFDGTGTVNTIPTAKKSLSVNDQLLEFRSQVYQYDGTKHNPRYLKILWGPLEFRCVMTSLTISYKLFSSDGYPLRAKVTANFKSFVAPDKAMALLDKQSPDLTHVRNSVEGDALPALSHTIYDDWTRYIELAKANGLDHFRELRPGTNIIFPPIR